MKLTYNGEGYWTLYRDTFSENDDYVKFRVENPSDIEILLDSLDMSKDNAIFLPRVMSTPEDEFEFAIIGDVFVYSMNRCIRREFVGVHLLDTNLKSMVDAKRFVEHYFASERS